MKFILFVLPTIPATLEERAQLRPIGRNTEKYQAMIEEVRHLAIYADEIGFDAFSMTEHHFHGEGFETSVSPLLWFADLAARTKNIKFVPLALVLPGHHPIQVAEELAMLDQFTKGRVMAGFARGYQNRWLNVMGQKVPVEAATMDGSDVDNRNRAVFDEALEIIHKAWTSDLLQHDGEFWKIPYPYEGIKGWPNPEWTRKYGAPGEIDDEGTIRGVCVVPRPYQEPYPPSINTFSVSESTIRQTAKSGTAPMIMTSYPDKFRGLCQLYHEEAQKAGRDIRFGEGVGVVRAVTFGDTEEEAVNLLRETNYRAFQEYFAGFGFWEALRMPEDDEKYPGQPLPESEWTIERFRASKYALAGTAEQVKAEIREMKGIYGGGGELEYFCWYFDQGLMSFEESKRQIEIFANEIMPEFR